MAAKTQSKDPLAEIDARLARIEATMDRLSSMVDLVPGGVAMAADTVDEYLAGTDGSNSTVEQRVQRTARLLAKLTEPQTLTALEQMVTVLQQLPQLPQLAAVMGDTFDDTIDAIRAYGIDVEHTLNHIKTSGALRSHSVEFALTVAALVSESANAAGEQRLGFWGLMKATRDPQVQKALAFLVDVAKRLGGTLEQRNNSIKALPGLED